MLSLFSAYRYVGKQTRYDRTPFELFSKFKRKVRSRIYLGKFRNMPSYGYRQRHAPFVKSGNKTSCPAKIDSSDKTEIAIHVAISYMSIGIGFPPSNAQKLSKSYAPPTSHTTAIPRFIDKFFKGCMKTFSYISTEEFSTRILCELLTI